MLKCRRGEGLIDGFSPVAGQTKSPYIHGDIVLDEGDLSPSVDLITPDLASVRLTSSLKSPGGSSTGSAVSVSAGFAVIGIGTETDGSIVQPASRQALYALKPTVGLITAEGCWRSSKTLDVPGVMARSTHDVAIATEAMLDDDVLSQLPEGGYLSSRTKTFEGLKIGFVDPTKWRLPPDLWTPSDEAKSQHVRQPWFVFWNAGVGLTGPFLGFCLQQCDEKDEGSWSQSRVSGIYEAAGGLVQR
jgi:amidase